MNTTTAIPATDKQIAFAMKLQEERGIDSDDISDLSKSDMSNYISQLLAMPKKGSHGVTAPVELESGIYRRNDTIVKVYKGQSGRMLAKKLVLHIDGDAHFDYIGLAVKFVKPEHKLTLEQAKEFGAIYGVCCNCGATLTDEKSIAAGIGPVCAKSF